MLGLGFLEWWFVITVSSLITYVFFIDEEAEEGVEEYEHTD